eukprot:SAG22_NODE_144_length_17700_cov_21.959207_14_plen_188_part_00
MNSPTLAITEHLGQTSFGLLPPRQRHWEQPLLRRRRRRRRRRRFCLPLLLCRFHIFAAQRLASSAGATRACSCSQRIAPRWLQCPAGRTDRHGAPLWRGRTAPRHLPAMGHTVVPPPSTRQARLGMPVSAESAEGGEDQEYVLLTWRLFREALEDAWLMNFVLLPLRVASITVRSDKLNRKLSRCTS